MESHRKSYKPLPSSHEYTERRIHRQFTRRNNLQLQLIAEQRGVGVGALQQDSAIQNNQLNNDIISIKQKISYNQKKDAIVMLRCILSSSDVSTINPAIDIIVNDNVLIRFIIDMLSNSENEVFQVEASWCITNIAAGNTLQTKSVICTTPLLISYLSSKNNLLEEQCSWALLNIANDNSDFRDTLVAQGIIGPLVKLFSSNISLGTTLNCCYLMMSLVDKQNYSAFQLLLRYDILNELKRKLGQFSDKHVIMELLWLLNDFLEYKEVFEIIIRLNFMDIFITLLGNDGINLTQPVEIIFPLVRALGRVFSNPNTLCIISKSYGAESLQIIKLLYIYIKSYKVISKESIYLLSNIFAMESIGGEQQSNCTDTFFQLGYASILDSFMEYDLDTLVELMYLIHNLSIENNQNYNVYISNLLKAIFKNTLSSAIISRLPEQIKNNLSELINANT